MRKKLIAGNWKMNGSKAMVQEMFSNLNGMITPENTSKCDVLLCVPFVYITEANNVAGSVNVGAQDCHANESGAHTADISANMLKDLGTKYVILGHSERRTDHGERNDDVAAKAAAANAQGLVSIVCIGETQAEKESGKTLDVCKDQLLNSLPAGANADNTVIAYEPVWAIGTGLVPTADDVQQVHAYIREISAQKLGADSEKLLILYGGSLKPDNAAELLALPDVDGGLIGGASLKAEDFYGIIKHA